MDAEEIITDNAQDESTLPVQDLGPAFVVLRAAADGTPDRLEYEDDLGEPVGELDLRVLPVAGEPPSPCPECPHSRTPWPNHLSVRRNCARCGLVRFEGPRIGSSAPTVAKGDDLVLPLGVASTNPGPVGATLFTRRGVDWLARRLFFSPLGPLPKGDALAAGMQSLADQAASLLSSSPLLQDLDLDTQEGYTAALARAQRSHGSEFAALILQARAQLLAEEFAGDAATLSSREIASAAWTVGASNALLHFRWAFAGAAYHMASSRSGGLWRSAISKRDPQRSAFGRTCSSPAHLP